MKNQMYANRFVLGGSLILFMCLCMGCASAAPKSMIQNDAIGAAQADQVLFPADYKGGPVSSIPVNWKDYYDTASYHFLQGNYEQACRLYQEASELSQDEEARLTALTAAAMSALGANDRPLFLDLRQQVTQSVQNNAFREATITDRYIKYLNTITFY